MGNRQPTSPTRGCTGALRVIALAALVVAAGGCSESGGEATPTEVRPLDEGDRDVDADGDGLTGTADNCPTTANRDQRDVDGDGLGDACDAVDDRDAPADDDRDGDGTPDASDNCPVTANADQRDTDGDGTGDACDATDDRDADGDGDGTPDASDNCPVTANADQRDSDGDGTGDACDATDDRDADGDGEPDATDNCPAVGNPGQEDLDDDGTGDVCDDTDDREIVDGGPPDLNNLLGRVRFRFGFTGAAEVMEVTTTFESDDFTTLDDGGDALAGVEGGISYFCDTFPPGTPGIPGYLCLILPIVEGGEVPLNQAVAFGFDLGADGRGSGDMEYCPNDAPLTEALGAECGADLILSPDGFVEIEVDGVAAARSLPLGKELIEFDLPIYLENAKRAQAEPVVTADGIAPDTSAMSAALERAREYLSRPSADR